MREAEVACALVAFGKQQAWEEGVPLHRLEEEVFFLDDLFKGELIDDESPLIDLKRMINLGVIEKQPAKIHPHVECVFVIHVPYAISSRL